MSNYNNFGYPEPPGLDCLEETAARMFGLLKTKENYDKMIKEIEQPMKPKVEYCDLCGKQFNQQWDSVTNTYFFTNKYPFIDKFICGSCAFRAQEWFRFTMKQNKKQPTVVEQKEVEIPIAKKFNVTVVEQKEVDKEKEKCNNCLYKIRDCKLKCNTCHEYSNYKEAYA